VSAGAGPALPEAPPSGCVQYKTTAVFDERTTPQALLTAHSTKAGVWAVVRVLEGALAFETTGRQDAAALAAGDTLACPPELEHRLRLDHPVRFQIEFWREP